MAESTASNSKRLKSIWLVPIVTGLGYLISYTFQAGYYEHFGIPVYLIDINIPQIFIALVPFVFFVLITIFLSDFFSYIFKLKVARYQDRQRALLLVLMLYGYFGGLFLLRYFPVHWRADISALLTLIAVILIVLIGIKKIANKQTARRDMFKVNISEIKNLTDYLQKIFHPYSLLVIFSIVLAIFSYSAGLAYASLQNGYFYPVNNPTYVIIGTYKSEFIAIGLKDSKSNFPKNRFLLMNPQGLVLERRHIRIEAVQPVDKFH